MKKNRGWDMKCEACGVGMTERKATLDAPYAYDLSGLRGIYLAGIVVRTCLQCRAETPVIPKVPELHSVIARELVKAVAPVWGGDSRPPEDRWILGVRVLCTPRLPTGAPLEG